MRVLLTLIFLNSAFFASFSQTEEKTSKSRELTTPTFDAYKVDSLFEGQKHSIDYRSNVTARRFKTRITNTYKEVGLNFGGHYCFVEWGCGSPCQASAIVDLKTGKVYDAPDATRGYVYKKDSRLLIVNPTDTTGHFPNDSFWG